MAGGLLWLGFLAPVSGLFALPTVPSVLLAAPLHVRRTGTAQPRVRTPCRTRCGRGATGILVPHQAKAAGGERPGPRAHLRLRATAHDTVAGASTPGGSRPLSDARASRTRRAPRRGALPGRTTTGRTACIATTCLATACLATDDNAAGQPACTPTG